MAARTTTRSRRSTKKAAPVEEELDDELEAEVEEDEVEEDEEPEEEAPAPKRGSRSKKAAPKKAAAKPAAKAAKAEKETLGTAWLKEHINDTLGTEIESTKIRIVLRKLIKEDVIESPKDGRYIFTGPRDPNVKAVIAALKEESKSGPAKRGRKPKAKAVAEVDEDDEVEDLDLDDDE